MGAEAFGRACASWSTVSRHPVPAAWVVRTALNANISCWRRRSREVSVPDPGMVADLPAGDGTADGLVDVTIRELRDPAGLQSKLRADGVPASVTFSGQPNPSCRPYPAG
jgi:DNA-directed RNA polymerase specialized sigma24 family protein